MELDISKIIQSRLPKGQYFEDKNEKKQIVLHHTVSNGNAKNVQAWWAKTPERIGTAFIIDGEGKIHQCFSSAQFAHHLGCKTKNNTKLNEESIGIEICSWGWLKKLAGKFYNSNGAEIPANQVCDLGQKWKGYQYWQKYTDKQIEATRQLLVYLCDTYNIDKTYQSDMWGVSPKALAGENGIFTHVSYRKDKTDCFPQPELIEMLQNL